MKATLCTLTNTVVVLEEPSVVIPSKNISKEQDQPNVGLCVYCSRYKLGLCDGTVEK